MPEIRDLMDSRLRALRYGIFATLLILFGGLYFFQIVHADKYVRLAYNNRLRLIRVSPPRGEIYDRNGVPLAVNETTFSIMGYPFDLDKPGMLDYVSELLLKHGIPMSVEDLKQTIQKQRWAPYRVIRLVPNLTMPQMAELVADPEFPPTQLFPMPVWRRVYPSGALAANITGYVGEISENELKDIRYEGYFGGDLVGKGGIERYYEESLRGTAGEEAIEVNAKGRKVRTIDMRSAEKGRDIHLTLDMGAQRRAMELLNGRKGAIIAMDIKTGAVLVSASSPAYDNNPLSWGVSAREWRAILEDQDKPMLDRAISGVYPPASTFKALVALAALEEGVITPATTYHCAGVLHVSRPFRCWRRSGHGSVNLSGALQHSCDVYFYQVGMKLGIERLLKWVKKFGLGNVTEIDMPSESSGNIAGPEWKKTYRGQSWYQGDTVNYSIGQGFLLLTPLQMVRLYAAIANGGYLVSPHLNAENFQEPEPVGVTPDALGLVQKGLDNVVQRGTGSRAGRFGIAVAGKTGTAQNSQGLDHALFAGYAPADKPQYAAVAIVEGGEHGSSIASPIVGEILAHLLSHPAENYASVTK